jgi:hypothetical protein
VELKHLLALCGEQGQFCNLITYFCGTAHELRKKMLCQPVELVVCQEVIKSADACCRKKLEEELTLSVHELDVPAHKIGKLFHLGHDFSDCLLNDIVKGVEELVIDGLGFLAEVKLVLTLLVVEAMFHQVVAHRMTLWQEEVTFHVEGRVFVRL